MKTAAEQKKQSISTWRNKFPEKYTAILSCKKLLRPPGYQLHHWSYRKEHKRDVIALTIKVHNLVHKFIIYDQEIMMYRIAKTGELLDSKEAHQEFIDGLILIYKTI